MIKINKNKFHGPTTVDLKVKIKAEEYILYTLSLNLNKEEMSLHFNDAFKKEQLNLDTGELTSPLDHITFHKGVRQVRLFEFKSDNKLESIFVRKIPFLPSSKVGELILVEEFFLNSEEKHCLSKESKIKSATPQTIASFEELIDFSLIMFILPTDCETNYFMQTSGFNYKNEYIKLVDFAPYNYPIGRINCFKDFYLLMFITPYTRDISKIKQKLDSLNSPNSFGQFRTPNYISPLFSIGAILESNFTKI